MGPTLFVRESEVSKTHGISQRTIKRASQRGELPTYRVGGRGPRYYRREDVARLFVPDRQVVTK
jgi:DNA-binding transcriptional MerR regulator